MFSLYVPIQTARYNLMWAHILPLLPAQLHSDKELLPNMQEKFGLVLI